jgi:hypothetical protein
MEIEQRLLTFLLKELHLNKCAIYTTDCTKKLSTTENTEKNESSENKIRRITALIFKNSQKYSVNSVAEQPFFSEVTTDTLNKIFLL